MSAPLLRYPQLRKAKTPNRFAHCSPPFFFYIVCLFILLITAINHQAAQAQEAPQIIGGGEASTGDWPWVVALVKADLDDNFWAQHCAGTLIDPEWVLTAAHCTYRQNQAKAPAEMDILLTNGSLRDEGSERVQVVEIIRHPSYVRMSGDADIALLRLEKPIDHPFAQLLEAFDDEAERAGRIATVVGWGKTNQAVRVDSLQQVEVPFVSQSTCVSAYQQFGYTITTNMLCAGLAEGGKDACSGDSGGPIMVPEYASDETTPTKWLIAGIVSWGKDCAKPNAYGVYTRVSNFVPWIYYQIWQTRDWGGSTTASIYIGGLETKSYRTFIPLVQ